MDYHRKILHLGYGIALLLLCLSFSAFAEEFLQPKSEFLIRNWTTDTGLPQNSIKAILQTNDGYIWLATFGGLARFDGLKFTIFNPTNTPELKDNRFTSLYQDSEGLLWITSEYGNIYYFENDEFHKFYMPKKDNNRVFVQRDADGSIWLKNDQHVTRYQFQKGDDKEVVLEDYDFSGADSVLQSVTFGTNVLITDDRIWVTSLNGHMVSKDRHSDKILEYINIPPKQLVTHSIFNPMDGSMWIITETSIGKLKNGNYVQLQNLDRRVGFSNSATYTENNNLWLATEGLLYKISNKGIEKHQIETPDGVKAESLVIDKEQNIWIGSKVHGLFRLKSKRIRVFGRIVNKSVAEAVSIFEDSNATTWVGTRGLLKFEDSKPKLAWEKVKGGLPQTVSSIDEDKFGTLWFSYPTGILNKRKDGSLIEYDPQKMFSTEGRVNSLYFDNQNQLWVGTNLGLGLWKDNAQHLITTNEGLVNNWILSILQARNGDMIIGTVGGMSIYHDGSFTNYTTDNGLVNNNVRDTFEEPDGTLWIGTYGGGISRFKNGKFVSITSKDGLPEDVASCILLDDYDYFWVLGNQGIYSISRQMLNDFADGRVNHIVASAFNENDGMITAEGNGITQYSGIKAKDGTLWFAMVKGVVAITPKRELEVAPSVYIEHVSLGNNEIPFKDGVDIQYGDQNLEIDYTGLSFSKPESVQFRYKLDGFDNDWNFVGTRRVSYYSFLPAGDYVFRVQGINADGVWCENIATVVIRVNAPFWRKWWFYLAVTGLIIFGVILIALRRLHILERERQIQQNFSRQLIDAHESERKRIASDLHDGIGQSLLVIKNWALLALHNINQKDEIETRLTEISDFASGAIEDTRTIAANLMPLHLKRFGLTETLKNMISNVSKATGISFEVEVDSVDEIMSDQMELNIYRIIQECLNNIVKHSKTKTAKISVRKLTSGMRIIVQDFGKGFHIDPNIPLDRKKSGFGLFDLTERVKLIDGEISITSKIDVGTTIKIDFAVPTKNA